MRVSNPRVNIVYIYQVAPIYKQLAEQYKDRAVFAKVCETLIEYKLVFAYIDACVFFQKLQPSKLHVLSTPPKGGVSWI